MVSAAVMKGEQVIATAPVKLLTFELILSVELMITDGEDALVSLST